MMILILRKSCSPEETIKRIKNILSKYKLRVAEKDIICYKHLWYSIRIELCDFDCGCNGKGSSLLAAKASGYAELMERIQSRYILFESFGNYYPCFDDEEMCLEESMSNKNNQISTLKMRDIITNEITYFSENLINVTCGSNGLCAGNTFKEAVSQGVCEIFERYVHKMLYFDFLSFPCIPKAEIKNEYLKRVICEIESNGYLIEIKDCTLSGKLPVIGMLLYSNDRKKYKFTIGSDFDFDIALNRCITELFQGRVFDEGFSAVHMKDINRVITNREISTLKAEWAMSFTKNDGNYPISLFWEESYTDKYKKAFLINPSIDDCYKRVVELSQEACFKVYIFDYSFMGFPTYRVFVPGMTEIVELDENHMEIQRLKKLRHHNNDLRVSLRLIELLNQLPEYKGRGFEIFTQSIIIDDKHLYKYLDSDFILILFGYKTDAVQDLSNAENPEYYFYLYSEIYKKELTKALRCRKERGASLILKLKLEDMLLCNKERCNICLHRQNCKFEMWNEIDRKLRYHKKEFEKKEKIYENE